MNKIIRDLCVILWLTLSLSALAQNAPTRTVEEKVGNCWEETNPADPIGCLAQIEKAIFRLKAEKTPQNKKSTDMSIKFLKVDKKRIESQAKAKINLAERYKKHEESEQKAVNNANISCPKGQTEPVRILSFGHFQRHLWQAFQDVVITNPHNFTVRISALDGNSQKAGDVVDLPAFCTITVTRSLDVRRGEAGRIGGVYYSYAAQPLHVDNFQGIARSPQYYLYPGNNFGQARSDPWVIGRFQMNY